MFDPTVEITNPYGIKSRGQPLSARETEWHAFRLGLTPAQGGLGKAEHFMRAAMLTWPHFLKKVDGKTVPSENWNPWLVRNLRAFANDEHAVKIGETTFRTIVLSGCAAAGKTQATALYAVGWWACDPHNSIAIMTSTEKGMIRKRIWPAIQFYSQNMADSMTGEPLVCGHMIDSQTTLQAEKGDYKHAIFSMAVAGGETQNALQNLKGMHAERMLLVIDEANATPEAIFHAITNLRKGCRDFTLIVLGNPHARMDAHGRCAEPVEGWKSIGQDSREWRTKAISEWQVEQGVCLRFDGKDSPNVKAGRDIYPYLYGMADWETAKKHEGTAGYWSQDRGMWPPDGMSNTIFNENLIERCEAVDHFTFMGPVRKIGFLDSAFGGGDACVFQEGLMGEIEGGKTVVQLTDWLEVPISVDAQAHDVDYQIARRMIEECRARNINPECFGLDATGIGRGVAAIIASEWSPQIQRTEWGTSATERPSSQNDGRPGVEVYSNFVAEMWFACREAMEAAQLKGFSREAIFEFCARQYEMKGKRYKIEPKADMKGRMKFSPDHADAVAGLVEVARRNGLEIAGKVAPVIQQDSQRDRRKAEDALALQDGQVSDGGWAEQDIRIDFREVA